MSPHPDRDAASMKIRTPAVIIILRVIFILFMLIFDIQFIMYYQDHQYGIVPDTITYFSGSLLLDPDL